MFRAARHRSATGRQGDGGGDRVEQTGQLPGVQDRQGAELQQKSDPWGERQDVPDGEHERPRNGKVARFNRTLAIEWAYSQVFTSNTERSAALDPWLAFYNTERRHSALGGKPPISRLT